MMTKKHLRSYLVSMVALLLVLGVAPGVSGAPPAQGPILVYQTANFTVNYNPNTCQGTTTPWPAEGQAALNHTIDILDDLVNSTPTIEIDACYENSDDPDTLAAAGPTDSFDQSTVPSLPQANVSYGVALANAISGTDNNGDRAEIDMTVNQAISWDFSTTVGATPNTDFDFVSTVLHELIHGLGFVDTSNVDGGVGTLGDQNGLLNIYDTFLVDNSGTELSTLPNDSAALADALQAGSGNVQWAGPNAIAANSNARPIIYAPNPYSQGSSIGHLDDDTAENAGRLMRAATGEGPAAQTPSAITLMMLKDIGWSINEASDYGDLPAAYALTTQANDGARHISNSLRLGSGVTTEADGTTSDTAAADGSDNGVGLTGPWSNGVDGGTIQVSVGGGRGCLSAWIDWDGNDSFADAGEEVITMQAVTGFQSLSITVPDGTFNGTDAVNLFARFRLMPDLDGDGDCSVNEQKALTAQGTVFGGEVEDYQLQFEADGTPTSPTLTLNFIYLPLVIK